MYMQFTMHATPYIKVLSIAPFWYYAHTSTQICTTVGVDAVTLLSRSIPAVSFVTLGIINRMLMVSLGTFQDFDTFCIDK